MHYRFNKQELCDFEQNIRREWVLTNGIGGYCGSSIIGAHNRTHQGYLIACLKPPVSRYLCFSKTNESFSQGGVSYDLTTAQHLDKESPDKRRRTEGQKYLEAFDYDGTICYTYKAGNLTIRKHISLAQGTNLSALAYEFENTGDEADFTITPLMNYREHSASSTAKDLAFKTSVFSNGFTLIPDSNPQLAISLSFSQGQLRPRKELFDTDMQLQTEVDNEVDGLDTHYTPFDICFTIPAKNTMHFSITCQVTDAAVSPASISSETAFQYVQKQLDYVHSLSDQAGFSDSFADSLAIVANQFLCHRQSTGYKTILAGLPWFTDWGRDTMIAYTGVTLATKQFDAARDILLTFARYEKNGMIPNMFPDDGQDPLYNTADASMWYFYAVYKYLTYVNTPKAYAFIQDKIYPVLKRIIKAHIEGTDFSIYMDNDYLLHAGSGIDQVTWMDVRVGDWVPTPRHGKPVEINALWYNALKVMEHLARHYGEDPSEYADLALKVKSSYVEKFWNPDTKCLYDVVSDESDPTIRPNQIYAVSLPFTMLDPEKEKSIVEVVHKKLYVGCGLRSLDPDHKDYHPIYIGALEKRDAAYHQGTAWGLLLGGFITAYGKGGGNTPEAKAEALKLLAPVKEHLLQNCIGSISEIFDGDAPHYGRGCYAQAWSVGEILRCYTEDIMS